MNDKQLRTLITVAEFGSFSKAEEQLFISKQALKKQMDALEAELQVTLLIRSPRGITLTPAGEAFLKDAQQLSTAIITATERCRSVANQEQTIRIEVPHHPRLLLEKVITQFTRQYPHIKPILTLHPDGSDPIQRILMKHTDIIEIAGTIHDLPKEVLYTPLIKLPYMCLMLPTHPLAQHSVLLPQDLHGQVVAINRFAWRQELLHELKPLNDIHFQEYPDEEEISAVYNACYSRQVYITAAYYACFLQPLIAIPLQIPQKHQLGVIHSIHPNSQTQKFLTVAQDYFEHYHYLDELHNPPRKA